jgi:hypothetical protein
MSKQSSLFKSDLSGIKKAHDTENAIQFVLIDYFVCDGGQGKLEKITLVGLTVFLNAHWASKVTYINSINTRNN